MQGWPTILYVEDQSNDVELLELACEHAKVSFRIRSVGDGEQAIQLLNEMTDGKTAASDALPALVLLDLKLPIRNGFEVLKWIRAQAQFEHLPVIVFTSSTLQQDMILAYRSGANGYLVKPPGIDELSQLANAIDLFWLRWNRRPEKQGVAR